MAQNLKDHFDRGKTDSRIFLAIVKTDHNTEVLAFVSFSPDIDIQLFTRSQHFHIKRIS